MAAGNSHADQQNMELKIHAQHPAEISWHLPPENFRPSFVECWHEASMGQPQIQIKPPGGGWTDQLTPMTCANRIHGPSSRAQTVLRLPPTAAWTPAQTLAQSGDWGVRFVFEREGHLNLHLAMMTVSPQSLLRQARIRALPSHSDSAFDPPTLSGLIPFMSQVVVAQTLESGSGPLWVERPAPSQLSRYCGRPTHGNPVPGCIQSSARCSHLEPARASNPKGDWHQHGCSFGRSLAHENHLKNKQKKDHHGYDSRLLIHEAMMQIGALRTELNQGSPNFVQKSSIGSKR